MNDKPTISFDDYLDEIDKEAVRTHLFPANESITLYTGAKYWYGYWVHHFSSSEALHYGIESIKQKP